MKLANLRCAAFCSTILLGLMTFAGCGESNSDAAYYTGDEEATREHMKEVEFEEQAHYRESGGANAAQPQGDPVQEEERAHQGR
jgi:hypothetical protein